MPLVLPDWFLTSDDLIGLEWHVEGDEWLHHLMVALAEEVPMTGHGRTLRRAEEVPPLPEHYEIRATSDMLTSSLRLVLFEKGLLLVVTGNGDPAPDQIEPWKRAVREAVRRLGKAAHTFEWQAIVGPAPSIRRAHEALSGNVRVGELELRPGGTHFFETWPHRPPSLFGRQGFRSWPVLVFGKTKGYNWFVAGQDASRRLRRLCGLLSVAWGGTWTIRQAPHLSSLGDLSLPSVSPWERDQDPSVPEDPVATLEVPEWLNAAWIALPSDVELDDALAAHHEGLLMKGEHPSFALVAFFAAVEAIGARTVPLVTCPTCGFKTGSGKRFKTALAAVRTTDEVRALATLYTRRSQTAHAGRLHGTESTLAFIDAGFFTPDAGRVFEWGHLEQMESASRDVMVHALSSLAEHASMGDEEAEHRGVERG